MKLLGTLWLGLALLAPSAAVGQSASPDFRGLWTGWRDVNASAMALEKEAVEEVRQDYVTAGSERRRALHQQGRALGERVGEVVRTGDCEGGERMAREAGDFALVAAVRAHCRSAEASPER